MQPLRPSDQVLSGIRRRSGCHEKVKYKAEPANDNESAENQQAGPTTRSSTIQFANPPGFDVIPLTPRPNHLSRGSSEATFVSHCSQLPALDHLEGNKSSKLLSHGFSCIASRVSNLQNSSLHSLQRSRLRAESVMSKGSMWSARTAVGSITTALGTTDKFTHKWPQPINSIKKNTAVHHDRFGTGTLTLLNTNDSFDFDDLGMFDGEKWSTFKWSLFLSVLTVLAYGTVGLICAIMMWFRTWDKADVVYVADHDILILIALGSFILVFTSLVGLTGVLLNSRPILAVYTLLLWPALVSILAVGYTSYKRATFSLDHKLDLSWSQYYTQLGRLLIQDALHCCGFYNALHEATPSKTCYPRTPLPGCKGRLYEFERQNLATIWSTTFSLVPLHLLNTIVALLCANHLTPWLGRGITPKQYRLNSQDVRTDVDKILRRMNSEGVFRVLRPEISRTSSSAMFREDREHL